MATFKYFSDPHVKFLTQILDEILEGSLLIPRFQRPFVWSWEARLDLFRSIRIGIPMGAIMVWRTNESRLRTYNEVGNIRFREPIPEGARQYLLDGVQRLSTLIASLSSNNEDILSSEMISDVIEQDREAFFDLRAGDFIALRSEQFREQYHLPLNLLTNSVALIRFQRALSGPEVEKYIELSENVAKAFREYKVPVIPILTEDVGLASQTFQRINSAGVQMSEKDMLHALTYSDGFDFSNSLESFRDFLGSVGWGNLDDDLILKIVKAALGLDIYSSNVDKISEALKKNDDILGRLRQVVPDAASFFINGCGIASLDMIPYGLQIVAVLEAFRLQRAGLGSVPGALADWVWYTTYTEYFTGLSGGRVAAQLEKIRSATINRQELRLDDENVSSVMFMQKSRFDFRSARSRAFVCSLARTMDKVASNQGSKLVEQYDRAAVVQGIPKEFFSYEANGYASPGNRFIVEPHLLKNLRDTLMGNEDISDNFAAANGISEAARGCLKEKRFNEFVGLRHQTLAQEEGEFVRGILTRNGLG